METDRFDFPKEEERILAYWDSIQAFETSLKLSANKPLFSFYDGPPFATGLPHYGHILAGTIKDIVLRYASLKGFHVERRFGWDCHGLPIEHEIDKKLGITGKDDIMKMGVAAYNAECRSIVMRYSTEWEQIVKRSGRWIDFKNDFKTMYPSAMESVWWVFKTLFDKGKVYEGYKVMPYSTACTSPLSNFEANLNYKDIQDPAVVVSFPLLDEPEVSLLIWTTTPWTLPSNLAIIANAEFTYVKIRDLETQRIFILLEKRLDTLYKAPVAGEHYEVLETLKGSALAGRRYEPLFPYFAGRQARGNFCVVTDNFVTDDAGTGLVHSAPGFGEDDQRVGLATGFIDPDEASICPVDDAGRLTLPLTDFAGLYFKDADKEIIKDVKAKGRLIRQSTLTHSYPFCWRSDTPLMYRAVPSWFVRVADATEQLLRNNLETHWVPQHVQLKKFANWLENARDWAVSRNRYWGTPIPIWASEDRAEIVCVGSIAELEKLAGLPTGSVTDLHREHIDNILIPSSRPGCPALQRVEEVFDCWFESGSVPYSLWHYPFEKKAEFEAHFPADFIAEGIDQTRGWFYTLMVLSTLLFDRPPFKHLICNGLVLAADGKKMSKRLKNYPEPTLVMDAYGSDALRLYLINSPVVCAEFLKFREEGVRHMLRDVLLPWVNAQNFLMQQVTLYTNCRGQSFEVDMQAPFQPSNVMDLWILSATQTLVSTVRRDMDAYRLYAVVPPLLAFIHQLTNWYVRLNRPRLKNQKDVDESEVGENENIEKDNNPELGTEKRDANGSEGSWEEALTTLTIVLFTLAKTMAPFTPFLAENMYQRLRPYLKNIAVEKCLADGDQHSKHAENTNNILVNHADKGEIVVQADDSVHFLSFPEPCSDWMLPRVEYAVAWLQAAIEGGRNLRDAHNLSLKTPLRQVTLLLDEEKFVTEDSSSVMHLLTPLRSYIAAELNVHQVRLIRMADVKDNEEDARLLSTITVTYKVTPNFAVLGKKYKKDLAAIQIALKTIDAASLEAFLSQSSSKATQEYQVENLAAADNLARDSGDAVSFATLTVTTTNGIFQLTPEEVSVTRIVVDPPAGHCVTMIQPPSMMPINSSVSGNNSDHPSSSRPAILLLDTTSDDSLQVEGLARTLLNRVQKLRKKCNLNATDLIDMYYSLPSASSLNCDSTTSACSSEESLQVIKCRFYAALQDHATLFYKTLRTTLQPEDLSCQAAPKHCILAREVVDLDGLQVILTFIKPQNP